MRTLHNVNRTLHAPLLACLIGLAQATPAAAFQLDSETRRRIDAVFAEYDRTDGPGCAVGVVRAGTLAYGRGYGMGQLDHGIPLSERSVFYLASVAKQFAAAAIVIADHEAHLSLDDDVRRHIPEFPAYDQGAVTIRHLVHHTSGVRDYLTLMSLAGTPFENVLTDEAMMALITRQKRLNFVPGSEHLYSNSGYVLLAEIVKRATGRTLREYADEKIFRPLGMNSTHFHDDRAHVVRDRVFSFDPHPDGGWRTNYLMAFDKVGDGGLYSSVEDLARWDGAFYGDALGVPNFAGPMYERGVLSSGDAIRYARGLAVERRRGLQRVSHGGGFMAFRTMIARYPEQRTTVIALCNVGTANPGALSAAVEDILLEGAFTEEAALSPEPPAAPETDSAAAEAPDDVLAALAGSYQSEEIGATWALAAEEGRLVLRHPSGDRVLSPRGETADGAVFGVGAFELAFEVEGGRATAFVLTAGRVRNVRFDRARCGPGAADPSSLDRTRSPPRFFPADVRRGKRSALDGCEWSS